MSLKRRTLFSGLYSILPNKPLQMVLSSIGASSLILQWQWLNHWKQWFLDENHSAMIKCSLYAKPLQMVLGWIGACEYLLCLHRLSSLRRPASTLILTSQHLPQAVGLRQFEDSASSSKAVWVQPIKGTWDTYLPRAPCWVGQSWRGLNQPLMKQNKSELHLLPLTNQKLKMKKWNKDLENATSLLETHSLCLTQ